MRTDGCVLGRLTHQVSPIRKSSAQGSGVYNILCAICPCTLLAIPRVLMKFASVRALEKPVPKIAEAVNEMTVGSYHELIIPTLRPNC
jgi:hypothetical protein